MDDGECKSKTTDERGAQLASGDERQSYVHPDIDETDAK